MMSTEEVAGMLDVPGEVQRWTAKRKTAVVMRSIVKGETSAAEAARKHVTVQSVPR